MKIIARQYCLAACVALSTHVYADDHAHTFKVKTKGGLAIESADKAYSFKLGGRIQLDYNNYDGVMNADNNGKQGSDFFVRRSRLVASGTVAKDWAYKAEFNIGEDNGGDFTDLLIRYKGFGKQAVLTFGHQREPFGLENQTSSKNISTIERSAASNAFDVGRALGINVQGSGANWTYSAGLYERGQDDNQDIEFAYTGRATFLPVYSDDLLVHIGAGVRMSDGDVEKIESRPGIKQVSGSDRITTGAINGTESSHYNLEAAAVFGASHISAEYFSVSVDSEGAESTDTDGYYILAGWFLTGEQRPYSKKSGSFSKLKPNNRSGAYELAASYSGLNLDDNGAGNSATVLTLAFNWYANQYVRAGIDIVQTDYDIAINNEYSGTGVAARLQMVF